MRWTLLIPLVLSCTVEPRALGPSPGPPALPPPSPTPMVGPSYTLELVSLQTEDGRVLPPKQTPAIWLRLDEVPPEEAGPGFRARLIAPWEEVVTPFWQELEVDPEEAHFVAGRCAHCVPVHAKGIGIDRLELDARLINGRLVWTDNVARVSGHTRTAEGPARIEGLLEVRPDTNYPQFRLQFDRQRVRGLLPWQTVAIEFSEPVLGPLEAAQVEFDQRYELDAVVQSEPNVEGEPGVRGGVIGPSSWWNEGLTVNYLGGHRDLQGNESAPTQRTLDVVDQPTPTAALDEVWDNDWTPWGQQGSVPEHLCNGDCVGFWGPVGAGLLVLLERPGAPFSQVQVELRLLSLECREETSVRVDLQAAPRDQRPSIGRAATELIASPIASPTAKFFCDTGVRTIEIPIAANGAAFESIGVAIEFEFLNLVEDALVVVDAVRPL